MCIIITLITGIQVPGPSCIQFRHYCVIRVMILNWICIRPHYLFLSLPLQLRNLITLSVPHSTYHTYTQVKLKSNHWFMSYRGK